MPRWKAVAQSMTEAGLSRRFISLLPGLSPDPFRHLLVVDWSLLALEWGLILGSFLFFSALLRSIR